MIDLEQLGKYRENISIEAKQATGGLPHSIWETYSAFANAQGGVILLGVIEGEDKSLQAVDLPDPAWLVDDLWAGLNDPQTASANILTEAQVEMELVDGKRIIVITVPKAEPPHWPIYVEGDPLRGTYVRRGEGDMRCTPEEVRAMWQQAGKTL